MEFASKFLLVVSTLFFIYTIITYRMVWKFVKELPTFTKSKYINLMKNTNKILAIIFLLVIANFVFEIELVRLMLSIIIGFISFYCISELNDLKEYI